MDKGDDPIAAFGSAEEGDEPLLPYIDAQAFEQVDREAQKGAIEAPLISFTVF